MVIAKVATRSIGVGWMPVEYACREADGSLRPVPLGRSRAEMYCPHCVAPRCLFAPGYSCDEPEEPMPEDGKKDPIKVAAGLSPTGEPLRESCWNCAHLRMNGDGKYVCRYDPFDAARGRWTMENSRPKKSCNLFEMRLVMEIPPLEDCTLGGGE